MSEKLTVEDIGNRLFLLGAFKEDLNEMEVEEMDESELRAYAWLNGLIDSIMEETERGASKLDEIRQELKGRRHTEPTVDEAKKFIERVNEKQRAYLSLKREHTPSHEEKMLHYFDL